MSWISKMKDPMQMQGTLHSSSYFEGWYFRMIALSGECISLIPGYSTSPKDIHCFLQYILSDASGDGFQALRTGYLKYPIQELGYERDPFSLQIGESRFYRDGFDVQVETPEISMHGKLAFCNMTPIRTSPLTPNIMGWFAYFPWMECYHGVISMEHQLEGSVHLDGRIIDFTGGTGYLEKDWGTSFPKSYLWIQCNQFKSGQVSLMCSVAEIPLLGTRFQGHIINLILGGKEYRFATYNRSKISSLELQNGEVSILADHPRWSLRIHARLELEGALKAPQFGQMDRIIKEGLQGTVALELLDKGSGAMIKDEGINAGIELVGYY